jgi:hypothetical protein
MLHSKQEWEPHSGANEDEAQRGTSYLLSNLQNLTYDNFNCACGEPHLVLLATDGDGVDTADVGHTNVLVTQQIVGSCRNKQMMEKNEDSLSSSWLIYMCRQQL